MSTGWLATFLCASLVLGCGSSQAQPETAESANKTAPKAQTRHTEEDIPAGFRRIEERAIGFSVVVPDSAQRQEVQREGVAPGAWMWLGQTEEGSVYTVAYFGALELSDADREQQLAQAVIGIVQGCQGRVISAKRGVTRWGDGSIDVVMFVGVCGGGEPVFGRLHLHNRKMYSIFAIAKTPAAKETVKSFLRSLRATQ